jgi:hypothetical protein
MYSLKCSKIFILSAGNVDIIDKAQLKWVAPGKDYHSNQERNCNFYSYH